jgi:2,3-bisphosphoglycerate-independent phosphoglycerate mutase
MSAREVAELFTREIREGYAFAVINFANPDMVGHTGLIPAVIEAVETVDRCLSEVVAAVEQAGGVSLVTADHGNAEQMLEADGVSPHTAHTTNSVPLVVTIEDAELADSGALADLVPTCLGLLGIPLGVGMTGRNLVTSV